MAYVKTILTTGVVWARNLLLQAGTGTGAGAPGILLFASDDAVGNDDGTIKTLISYTLPANTLANDGDMLVIEASCSVAADADSKSTFLVFGGSTLCSRGAADNNLPRTHRAVVIRKSATTQVADGQVHAHGQGSLVTHTTPSETLSGTVSILFRGLNSDASANAIVSRHMAVWYYPIGRAANFQ